MDDHKNFAYSTLAATASTAATTLTVATGEGALFPTAPFNATLWPANVQPLATNAEIVRVTAISGDVFTVTRAQEASTAVTAAIGAQIAATITRKTLTDIEGAFAGAKVYSDGLQAVNNTIAALQFNQEEWDTDGFHSQASSAVNTKLTVPVGKAGKYLLLGGTFGSGGADYVGFYKNGNTAVRGYQTARTDAAFYRSASAQVDLAEGDYVEFVVSTTNNINFGHASLPDAQSWMSITLIGAAPAIAPITTPDITLVSRSSNTILGVADKGKFIDCSAAFTQTFDAATTLGAGWWVDIRNATTDGSSVLVLDPNSSETIDGATTMHMWSGEVRRVICDGSGFVTIMLAQGLGLYAQRTTDLSSLSTSEAGSTEIVSLGAQTYDAVPILLEGFAQLDMASANNVILTLWDDTTEMCRWADERGGVSQGTPKLKITPSAGSHTYRLAVFGSTGTLIDAGTGSGGAATYPPAFLRATKI